MGRIRRYGYLVEWFIGDHNPRHVHVYDSKANFLGRLDINTLQGLENWQPDRRLVKLILELHKEGPL